IHSQLLRSRPSSAREGNIEYNFTIMMKFTLALFLVLSAAAQNGPVVQPRSLQGFSRDGADRQRALEKQFDSFMKKDEVRDWMKRLSARPHHIGSAYGKENADFIARLFRSWGYDTAIERFEVLLAPPKSHMIAMTSQSSFT